MADDVRLRYGSTGFERVTKELRDLEAIGATSGNWFKSMQKSLQDAAKEHESFSKTFSAGLQSVASMAGTVVENVVKIGAAVTAVSGIVVGVGVAAFTKWSSSVLKTHESFRMLETSLYGATKSWEAVNKVSEFAKKYAAEYPAMYGDIMKAMQSFAYIPALKPMIMKGDVDEMHKMMTIVQGLMTMRPEQGVGGAIWSLREALAGNWRSLMMRFDVPVASIAKSAGMTMEEMKSSPAEAVKALKSFIDEFVGADTMAMMAKNLSIQIGNLKDKYEMWLDKLGKTGIYQKVVDYLLKLNDVQERFMKSERFQKWTEEINAFLESVVDRIVGVFTKGIDWEGIGTLGGLGDALKKVGSNAMEELKKVWDAAKEPLAEALKGVFKFVGSAAAGALKDAILPALKEVESEVRSSLTEYGKEHPVKASAARIGIGSAAGLLTAGPKGLLLGPLLESLKGYGDLIGLVVEKGAEGLAAVEKGLKKMGGPGVSALDIEADKNLLSGMRNMEIEGAWKTLGEIQEVLSLPWLKNAGFRKTLGLGELPETAVKGAEEMKRWMKAPPKGWTGPWGEIEPKEPVAWSPKAGSQLEYYSSWARMAKALAEREEPLETPFDVERKRLLEYRATREKWEYGQMGTADWRLFARKFDAEADKKMRLDDYTKQREEKLSTVLGKAVEEKQFGVQAKVFGEMFNIAYQKGDFGAAQDYMNKSLEAMLEQLKKSEKFESEDNESLKNIKESTAETLDVLKSWKIGEGKYSNVPASERDELVAAVRMAGGE